MPTDDRLIRLSDAKAVVEEVRSNAVDTWEHLSCLPETARQCSTVVKACDSILAALAAVPAADGSAGELFKADEIGRAPEAAVEPEPSVE